MKQKWSWLILLAFFVTTGCSGIQLPSIDWLTKVPDTQTPTVFFTPTSTDTPVPTSTLTPTFTPTPTLTPTPTIFMTPTVTPVNFALAKTGFDIANVRYSYPREDMLVVDFKYRVDEKLADYSAYITAEIPRRCTDTYGGGGIFLNDDMEENSFGMYFVTRKSTGEGKITFKMTLQGTCRADGLMFKIFPLNYPSYPYPPDITYEEYVPQPYEVTRSFPTMNLDVIRIRNFQFEPQNNWSGILSFDYEISEAIPISLEQYHFAVSDRGGGKGCYYYAEGPTLTEPSGIYSFDIELDKSAARAGPDCWGRYTSYTYSETTLYMYDDLADSQVLRMPTNFSYTFWKSY